MGWLINDCLTTIQGTKTFWHDLLEWIPDLEDKTGGHTVYSSLAASIESMARAEGSPDYIIRNATFFRPLRICKGKTIVFLQDHYNNHLRQDQIDVCDEAEITVFNSPYVYNLYKDHVKGRKEIIPIGIDFNFFVPLKIKKIYDVIYVGDTSVYPKGFDLLNKLINETNLKFCLVLKDDIKVIDNPRVKVFRRVDHNKLLELYNQSKMLVCTSKIETLHLAGVEAAACGLPIVATNVGIYFDRKSEIWGMISGIDKFINTVMYVLGYIENFDSRNYFLKEGLDKESCKNKWINLVDSLRD